MLILYYYRFIDVVVDVIAQKCAITSISPTDLINTGGTLKNGTPNVTIECNCNEKDDTVILQVRWFFPNGSQVKKITVTPPGSPYFISNSPDTVSTLIIPVFNDTYKGTYTCKPKKENSLMSNIQLLPGK